MTIKLLILSLFLWSCKTLEGIYQPPNKKDPPVVVTPEPSKGPKSLFPQQVWADKVWEMAANMPKVKDEKEFCPQGLTRTNWVHLAAAMVRHESNFRPSLEYKENFRNGKGEIIISTGLFQISYESSGLVRRGTKHHELHDPILNIEIAMNLLRYYTNRDGVVKGYWDGRHRGGSAYWAVLRPKLLPRVQATLKPLCE